MNFPDKWEINNWEKLSEEDLESHNSLNRVKGFFVKYSELPDSREGDVEIVVYKLPNNFYIVVDRCVEELQPEGIAHAYLLPPSEKENALNLAKFVKENWNDEKNDELSKSIVYTMPGCRIGNKEKHFKDLREYVNESIEDIKAVV